MLSVSEGMGICYRTLQLVSVSEETVHSVCQCICTCAHLYVEVKGQSLLSFPRHHTSFSWRLSLLLTWNSPNSLGWLMIGIYLSGIHLSGIHLSGIYMSGLLRAGIMGMNYHAPQFSFFIYFILLFMCASVFHLHAHLGTICMLGICGDQRRALDLLELEVQL